MICTGISLEQLETAKWSELLVTLTPHCKSYIAYRPYKPTATDSLNHCLGTFYAQLVEIHQSVSMLILFSFPFLISRYILQYRFLYIDPQFALQSLNLNWPLLKLNNYTKYCISVIMLFYGTVVTFLMALLMNKFMRTVILIYFQFINFWCTLHLNFAVMNGLKFGLLSE